MAWLVATAVCLWGAAAGAAPSDYGQVKARGASHAKWRLSKQACEASAQMGMDSVFLYYKSKHHHYQLPEASVSGKPGTTANLATTKNADVEFTSSGAKTWIAGYNPAFSASNLGSGTLKLAKNGKSGSLNAELVGGSGVKGKVHLTASWHCA